MDVLLAIPFSLSHSPDVLSLVGDNWQNTSVILGIVSTLILSLWIKRRVCGD